MAERRIIPPGIRDAVAVAYADLLGRYDAMAFAPWLADRL